MLWRDSLGAMVYHRAGRTTVWRLAHDKDVVVQAESAMWDLALAWSGLVWARDPRPWPACERASLVEEYLRAVASWVVLLPAARWSCLMRPSGDEWPVGLSRPPADTGTMMRYAMGESMCELAGLRPELLGYAVPVPVQDSQEHSASPDVVLRVGAPPSLQGQAREVLLAPPATSRLLFVGFTFHPLWDRPVLAYPAAVAPEGLLRALGAFLPVAPTADQPNGGGDEDAQAADQDLGLELDVDEDDEYLLS